MSFTKVLSFNKILVHIFEFLIIRFPECKELHYTFTKLKVGIDLSPKEPALVFMEHALKHSFQIELRDETYFLEETKDDTIFKNFNIMEKYSKVSVEDKTFIWDQVQKLYKLGDLIILESC